MSDPDIKPVLINGVKITDEMWQIILSLSDRAVTEKLAELRQKIEALRPKKRQWEHEFYEDELIEKVLAILGE